MGGFGRVFVVWIGWGLDRLHPLLFSDLALWLRFLGVIGFDLYWFTELPVLCVGHGFV